MEEKVKPHQVTTLHMVAALAFIVAGTIIVIYNYTIPLWGAGILLSGILLTILVMAKNKWVISPGVNPKLRVLELLLAAGLAVYSLIQQWKFPVIIFGALTAAILFALYWERPSDIRQFVHIDDEGVTMPGGGRKKFKPWTEIEEVIMRFGILTINCTNNTLYQWNITDRNSEDEVFAAYCTAQVEANREKRRKDDL